MVIGSLVLGFLDSLLVPQKFFTIITTYLCPLPLPKGAPPRCPPLVRLLPHFPPDKTRRKYHGLGIPQIHVYPHLLKHPYECQQHPLNSDGVSSQNLAIFGIEHYVVLPRCPSHTMLILLNPAYLHHCGPQYHINNYVEDGGGHWVSLGHHPIRLERVSISPPSPCYRLLSFAEVFQEPL